MNVEGIDVVFYWVTDIDRALTFYTGALGIEAGPRYGDWQEMSVPGPVRFALHGASPGERSVNAVVSFLVANLDQAMADLSAKGVESTVGVTETGRARFAEYADPDGNLVHILERLG